MAILAILSSLAAVSVAPVASAADETSASRADLPGDLSGLLDDIAELNARRASRAPRTVDQAARLLSVHPPGQMPANPSVLGAIATLQVRGTPADIAVLRDVLAQEEPLLANLAGRAIADIRARQRASQREAFATDLHRVDARQADAIQRAESAWRARGLGPTEARCAAYADRILGDVPAIQGLSLPDDPERLLERGEARAAVGALTADTTPAIAVRAYEDAGDVRSAIRVHALAAVGGDPAATEALESYGIEVERLVLGMLHTDRVHEPEALETLVRKGRGLTVSVLAERVIHPTSQSDLATAADALGRMLHTQLRPDPLPRADRERIRRTLWTASQRGDPALRSIAREALADDPGL